MCFSPELIIKIRLYFQKKYNVTLSDEEAKEYLNSLTNLFDLVTTP